jgi:hypothetical protein
VINVLSFLFFYFIGPTPPLPPTSNPVKYAAPKTLSHEGCQYRLKDKRKNLNAKNESVYRYTCATSTNCKAGLTLYANVNESTGALIDDTHLSLMKAPHDDHDIDGPLSKKSRGCQKILDLRPLMKGKIEDVVMAQPQQSARSISNQVMTSIKAEYKDVAFEFLDINQMKTHVYATKNVEFGNTNSIIKNSKLYYCDDDDERPFLQFTYSFNIDGRLLEMIGWGHPDLIHMIKGGDHNIFIDCTFKCCPKGYYQVNMSLLTTTTIITIVTFTPTTFPQ